ncbi:DeoR/GlpR family DNA-binding transcription regulator [Paenibacillus sp. NFR01]|uniref:DeoR/GlpR family DNA-binding transcription regulator n=1 Tax=Paenibacillus sp. NFR01 TaxID=1566279 RepID=UPI0008B32F21|nr:DeoR/GlpR family DNA-binding transcription regulator [Paenibacillus sp. NFR01]SEU26032.1 transcriptional regulator, DeoR family [Paenibacillus sp. NFR01]
MLAAERRKKIIDLVHQDKRVLVSDLSRMFDVTEETIRRDLEKLEKDGILSRTYGGAMLNRHTNEDLPFVTRNALNTDIKHSIALKALDLIKDGDTLMVDPSSTSFEFIKLLGNKNNLRVITNSINILHEFSRSGMDIVSTGGSLRHRSLSLVGPVAQETLRRYHVDAAVISCKGIDMERGITDSNEPECEVKKAMLRQAQKVILLADHTKFDQVAFTGLAELQNIDILITDREPSAQWSKRLAEHGIEVIY